MVSIVVQMIWLWLLAAVALAGDNCQPCHPVHVDQHARTRHAQALRPAKATELYRLLAARPIGEARDGYLFYYEPAGDALRVRAERGAESADGLIEWIFGAGGQGMTPLVRAGARYLEHRISYYPQAARFDLTLGHLPGASPSARAALGIEQPPATLAACFACHATATGNEIVRPGVECERCHRGAAGHATAKGAVLNPRQLTPREEVELCASCHRLTPPGRADDPLNIRFQPLRLVRSRCFVSGGLRCSHCHAAHQDAVTDAAFYRQRCLQCHPASSAKGDCLPCHMPRQAATRYLAFTDHWIRRDAGARRRD